jgi:hypothetical protein
VPLVARGQQFTVGFGADQQLRARRQLLDEKERTLGGNRETTYTYRLLIENFKDTKTQVRLLDRTPNPKQQNIRVTLLEPKTPLSSDSAYVNEMKPEGILRWDVEVPAQAMDDKAFTLDYEFKLEFERSLHIGVQVGEQERKMMEAATKAAMQ